MNADVTTLTDPNIQSNIVIALGDITISFSNIFDKNSDELYKGLLDHDIVVKKNMLMVLTHMILNGMIKVKDNAIYNNFPDGGMPFLHSSSPMLTMGHSNQSPFCR
jgi:non-SMC mitotic condensation complex subunit 1